MKFSEIILLSPFVNSALNDDQIRKLQENYSCDNFAIKIRVTKRQLYASEKVPKSNLFTVGPQNNCKFFFQRREIISSSIKERWFEWQKTVNLNFFNEKGFEKCGAILYQVKILMNHGSLFEGQKIF